MQARLGYALQKMMDHVQTSVGFAARASINRVKRNRRGVKK
jgi:hypothetical protein